MLQQAILTEPLSRATWKDILADKFIPFDKLHAVLDPSYDHHDEGKVVFGEFSLVKKDLLNARKPVVTESHWTRCFSAWAAGVALLYPHRSMELAAYGRTIASFFQDVAHSPQIVILLDIDIRTRYAKAPFSLDNTLIIQTMSVSRLLKSTRPFSSSKRSADIGFDVPVAKRHSAGPICINWNHGRCESDPCPNGRRHGVCSECGEKHRSRDKPSCFSAFWARNPKNISDLEADQSSPSSN
jgi:hypothetical protein